MVARTTLLPVVSVYRVQGESGDSMAQMESVGRP